MYRKKLAQGSGLALTLAGLSLSLWVLTHPWAEVTGPDVGQTFQWITSHTFHFFAGLLALFGLPGLAMRHWRDLGGLGRVSLVLAFAASALFTGTGMITAWVWPTIALHAPALVQADGPFFSPPHPLIVGTGLLFSLSYILIGLTLGRTGAIPAASAVLLVAGAGLLLVPPTPLGPLPWPAFVLGGALMGAGMFWVGLALQMARVHVPAGQPRSAAAVHSA